MVITKGAICWHFQMDFNFMAHFIDCFDLVKLIKLHQKDFVVDDGMFIRFNVKTGLVPLPFYLLSFD